MSDLHLECDSTTKFLKTLDPTGIDAVILAGDIASNWPLLKEALTQFCSIYPKVFFVAGNHDVYGRTHQELQDQLSEFIYDNNKGPFNLTCFDNGEVIWALNNSDRIITLYGTTAWVNPLGQFYQGMDLHRMKEPLQWMPAENQRTKDFLKGIVPREDETRILITHFIPHSLGIADRWRGDSGNWYFHNPLDNYIYDLDLDVCCFGHTHDPCNAQITNLTKYTRLLCNPRGYPNERTHKNYKPLTFEV